MTSLCFSLRCLWREGLWSESSYVLEPTRTIWSFWLSKVTCNGEATMHAEECTALWHSRSSTYK